MKYAAPAATIALAAIAAILFVLLVNADADSNGPVPAASPTVPVQPTEPPPTPDLAATVERAGLDATATAQAQPTATPQPTVTPSATATPNLVLAPYQAALDAGDPGPLPEGPYLWIERDPTDPTGRGDNRYVLRFDEGTIVFPPFQGRTMKFNYTSTEELLIVTDPDNHCQGAPAVYRWRMDGQELFFEVDTSMVERCPDRRVWLLPSDTGEGWQKMG